MPSQPTSTDNIECTVACGICNHAFYLHYILCWLKTQVCPLDITQIDYSMFLYFLLIYIVFSM